MFGVLTAVFGLTALLLWSRAEAREQEELDEMNRALLTREPARERAAAAR